MADNATIPGSDEDLDVACDEAPYSGDVAKIQLYRQVEVYGTEGSKTVLSKRASTANNHKNVSVSNSSTKILDANEARRSGQLRVDPLASEGVFMKYDAAAAALTDCYYGPGDALPLTFPDGSVYTGAVYGITTTGAVNVQVIEL